jgi:hypothetical protein
LAKELRQKIPENTSISIGTPLEADDLEAIARFFGWRIILDVETPYNSFKYYRRIYNPNGKKTVRLYLENKPAYGHYQIITPKNITVNYVNDRNKTWTTEEDLNLTFHMGQLGTTDINWEAIAFEMPYRNAKQCQERWEKHLNSSIIGKESKPDFEKKLDGYFALLAAHKIQAIDHGEGGNITINHNEVRRFADDLREKVRATYKISIDGPLKIEYLRYIAKILKYHIIVDIRPRNYHVFDKSHEFDIFDINRNAKETVRLYFFEDDQKNSYQIMLKMNLP